MAVNYLTLNPFNNMYKVAAVKPLPNYELLLTFTNHEVRRFDVKPYLNKGIFY